MGLLRFIWLGNPQSAIDLWSMNVVSPIFLNNPQFFFKHNPVVGVVYGIGFNTWLKFTKCGKLGNPWTTWRLIAWEKHGKATCATCAMTPEGIYCVYTVYTYNQHVLGIWWVLSGSQWMRTSYTTNQQEDFLSLINWNSHHWTLTTNKTTVCGHPNH